MKFKKTVVHILKRIYIPLRIKLSVSHLFIAVLPAFIITYVCYNLYSESILTETSSTMESVVEQTTQEIDKRFDSSKTLLLSTYMSATIKDILYNLNWSTETPPDKKVIDYNRISDLLRGILYLRQNISSIRLIPLHGTSIIWHENTLTMGYPYVNIPWYQQMLDADIGEALIPPHKPLPPIIQNQSDVFTIGKIVKDSQGDIQSILMIDVKTEEINHILNVVSEVNNLQLAILDIDGSIIFQSKNLQYSKFLDHDSLQKIKNTAHGTLKHSVNNEKYLLMYDTSQVSGWKFIAFTKESTLLAKAYKIRNISLAVSLASIAVALLLSILMSVRLTTPINRLYTSMEDVKNRNFDIYLPVTGNDEIGKLTRNFNSMVKRIRNLIVKEYEADIKRKEAELKALEAQINPHFLYNTLETISSIAYLRDVPEITTISRSLSKLFRYSISNDKRLVTLGDELYHTMNYVNISKIRHENKFSVVFDIPEELKDYKVIKLILQPLIENCVNHGLELVKSGGLITVSAELEQNHILAIHVEDNGIGIHHKKLREIQDYLSSGSKDAAYETSNSIGLANVHFRIQHYYGKDYGLTIVSNNENGTKVTIRVPV